MKKDSKILITGYTGFVGRNLFKQLKIDGYYNIHTYGSDVIDFRNQFSTQRCLSSNFDYVFICSAKVGGIKANIDDSYSFLYDNMMIQNNIINECIKTKVKKVLFLGSSCIYPKDYIQPLKEEYLLEAPLEPTNENYALAKITGLKLCESANKQFNTKFISLMPCNLYGDGDHFNSDTSHVLSALIFKIYNATKNNDDCVEIWGSGKQKREFMYIQDLISSMIWSMNNYDGSEGFLNVGTGEDISINDLANIIKVIMGYKGNLVYNTNKPDGMMEKCLDVSKINKLGWKHKTLLEDGIRKTIKWYIEHI